MKILSNEKLIKRNSRISQYTSLAGLLILVAGMWVSFARQEWINIAWIALLFGFMLSQIGIYFGNRWGRRPRPDEHLSAALKGMDDRWTLFHYTTPVSHLLVGPGGVWLLMPYHQSGKLSYVKNRWKMSGGGLGVAYMRLFAQENIGRPDLEIANEVDSIRRFFEKAQLEQPDIKTVMVMTNDKIEIGDIENAPHLAVEVKKLKDSVRKLTKENSLSPTRLELIQKALGSE